MNEHERTMIDFFNKGLNLIRKDFEGFEIIIQEQLVVPEENIKIIEKHYEQNASEDRLLWITGEIMVELCQNISKRDYLYLLITNLRHCMSYYNEDAVQYFENMSRDYFEQMVVGHDDITIDLLSMPIDFVLNEHTTITNSKLLIDKRYSIRCEFTKLTGQTLRDDWEKYLHSDNRHQFAYDYIINIIKNEPCCHINFSLIEKLNVDGNEFREQKNKVIDIIRTNPPIDEPIKVDGKFTSYIIVSQGQMNRIKLLDCELYKGLSAKTTEFYRDEYSLPGWGEFSIVNVDGCDYHCYTITAFKYDEYLKMENIIGNENETIRTKLYNFFKCDMMTFKI